MEKPPADPGQVAPDAPSQRWLAGLRAEGTRRDQALDELHGLLLRVARREMYRRSGLLGGATGPELDDLAHQAAGDALMAIVENLDSYKGLSRFTTWAYRFAINHVSMKTRSHLWSGRRVLYDETDWERLPDRLAPSPHGQTEQRAQLKALRAAMEEKLTSHQREVFVSVALNDVPIDVLALRLDTNRNAIYKTLFDARTKLRAGLLEAGYPIDEAITQP